MFKGIYCPCITPINEQGKIDYEAFKAQVQRLIDARVDGVLFLGSIGEFYAFNMDEKKRLVDEMLPFTKGKVKSIIGVGSTSYEDVVELANYSKDADAVIVISPYYFGPSALGAFTYFKKLANNLSNKIMLYNFPARTGSDLDADTVLRIAKDCENVVAIKDTVDCASHTRKIIEATKSLRKDFCVLSGFDEYYLTNRVSGGDGVLSGLTNIIPEVFVKMHKAYEGKDFSTCMQEAGKISKLMAIYESADLFIQAVKEATRLRGVNTTELLRGVAVELSSEQKAKIKELIKDYL